MLTNFISDAANAISTPVFGSPETFEANHKAAIRINIRSVPAEVPSINIYDRARQIYYRARKSHRLSRAAGIF